MVRRTLGTLLLVASAIAALLAIVAALTGGFRVSVYGVALSVRGVNRAALVAVILCAAGLALQTRARQRLPAAIVGLRRSLAPAVAVAASLSVLAIGLAFGTKAAAGADPYGYVSQVPLWLQGDLRVEQPMAADVPWPDAVWTFAPLGYRPGEGHTIVPTYAPGIPLLMALFVTLFGPGAEYWVTPLCGAALVLLTYAIGARLSSPAVGLAAALGVATSPVVLMMTCWLLGDLPAAAFWAFSLWLATFVTVAGSFGAGAAASIAIVIRPNLAPLAAFVPLLTFSLTAKTGLRDHVKRLAAFTLAAAPGPLFIAWLFNDLYGSPLRSGYGSPDGLFSSAHVLTNVANYSRWAWDSQGPLIFLFPLALVTAARHSAWRPRMALLLFIGAVVAAYLAYLPFEEWWYLRFLLPAIPLMFLLAGDAVWMAARRWGPRAQALALLVFTLAVCTHGAWVAAGREVLAIGRGEQRYAKVGAFVNRTLPENAVIFAKQHSGSLRFHAGRQTIRYEYLGAGWLDEAVAHLERSGYAVYVLLEHFEVPGFRERFAGEREVRRLEDFPFPAPESLEVRIHRLGGRGPGL